MARTRNPVAPLRDTLARAARQIVEAEGVEALTVRRAAAEAGVTANAPYFHFPGGVPEMIAAVAIAGFTELRDALTSSPLPANPVEAARETILRYVGFGVTHPELYRAMFHRRIAVQLESGATVEEGEATFAPLRMLKMITHDDVVAPLSRLAAEGALRGGHDPRESAGLALAALAHGLVGEFVDEGLVRPAEGEGPWTDRRQAMTVEVTDVLLLGLLGDASASRVSAMAGGANHLSPGDDPSWQRYHETILEFFPGERTVAVDLRWAVTPPRLSQLHDRGLPAEFAVLTGCNPRGRTISDAENARREQALKQRLRVDGYMWMPVDGVSPDGMHREPGVAVGMSREDARRLAKDFEQSAIYWFDGETFWIVGALVDVEGVRLPSGESRGRQRS